MESDGIIVEDGAVVERVLPVRLTQPELVERGQRMALAELKIETLKSERKLLNARISEQVELRATLGHVIDLGLEDRAVKCKWSADYDAKAWTLNRLDTGERLERRAMTVEDLQTSFDVVHDEAPPAAAPLTDPDGMATLDWRKITDDGKKPKAKASKRPPAPKAKAKTKSRKVSSHARA